MSDVNVKVMAHTTGCTGSDCRRAAQACCHWPFSRALPKRSLTYGRASTEICLNGTQPRPVRALCRASWGMPHHPSDNLIREPLIICCLVWGREEGSCGFSWLDDSLSSSHLVLTHHYLQQLPSPYCVPSRRKVIRDGPPVKLCTKGTLSLGST